MIEESIVNIFLLEEPPFCASNLAWVGLPVFKAIQKVFSQGAGCLNN